MITSQPTCYRFGKFHLNAESGELLADGGTVRLQPQPLQVLLHLLHSPGRVVTREEFRSLLWPGDTYVEFDDGLNHAIRRLRSALGDTAEVPRYIETIPRRGYRFIAEVGAEVSTQRDVIAEPVLSTAPGGSYPRWRFAVIFVIILALAFGLAYAIHQQRPAPKIQSLAVLPLANFSGDPEQEYFADAITEELTTELSRIKSLRVISRTSAMRLKGTKLSLQETGRELGVDAVVEGSVQRSGERVRITAQLVRVPTERHLWAESYERSLRDILLVRSEISSEIATHVRAEVAPHEPAPAEERTVVPEAFNSYLIGMRFFDEGTISGYEKSISYFEDATQKDPNYALAYAQLAEAHAMVAFLRPPDHASYVQAMASARKAMELDPSLPEAQIREADLKFYWNWDWPQCEGPFRRAALEANGSPDVQSHYGLCLEVLGRYKEALPYMENARRSDPLSTLVNKALGRLLARSGQTEEALEYLNKAKDLDPNDSGVYDTLAWIDEQQNQSSKAIEARIRAGRLRGDLPENSEEELTNAFRIGGITAFEQEHKKLLKLRIDALKHQANTSPVAVAALYVKTGDFDEAFRWLDKAYEQQLPSLVWLKSGLAWQPLRTDSRYQVLLRRMRMPE